MDRVHNIVQETVNKTIPQKKKSKKAKWLSEEASQIAKRFFSSSSLSAKRVVSSVYLMLLIFPKYQTEEEK